MPTAVGLPKITPELASICKPVGNPVALQVNGVVPPEACIGKLW